MHISFTKRKIQYLYLALTIVSILLGAVSYVRAEEPANTAQEAQAAKAVGARQKTLTVEQQDRFINLVRNVYGRMDAAVTRLDDITKRLETRIAKLESEGIDTSTALSALNDAKNKLDEAKSALSQAKANAESGIISDSPRERFKAARQQFVNIRQSIRDAYIMLRESVAALKDAVREAELNKGVSDAVSNSTAETPETETASDASSN